MPNLFAKARDWLTGQLQAAAGVSATYTRGASSFDLTPWVGRTSFRSDAADGARVLVGDRDYLIPADSFTAAVPAPPRVGDRVAETIDGADLTFEIQDPGTGGPAWEWGDAARTAYRVHVKRV